MQLLWCYLNKTILEKQYLKKYSVNTQKFHFKEMLIQNNTLLSLWPKAVLQERRQQQNGTI